MLQISEDAIDALTDMSPLRIRGVEVDGEVELEIEDATEPVADDQVVERDGVRIFLDPGRRDRPRGPGDRRARPRRPLPLHLRRPALLSVKRRNRPGGGIQPASESTGHPNPARQHKRLSPNRTWPTETRPFAKRRVRSARKCDKSGTSSRMGRVGLYRSGQPHAAGRGGDVEGDRERPRMRASILRALLTVNVVAARPASQIPETDAAELEARRDHAAPERAARSGTIRSSIPALAWRARRSPSSTARAVRHASRDTQ